MMRASFLQLRLLIIDEVSMVSSLNLAYIHLRLNEIFARHQWFGGVNVLFLPSLKKSESLTKESLQSPTEGRCDVPSQQRYNSLSVNWQRQACQHLGMQFVRANGSTPSDSDVPLTHPARCRAIEDDGNCLFRALSHAIIGLERHHSRLRSATVEHMRSLRRSGLNQSLEANVLGLSVEEPLARTRMDPDGSWGTDVEVTAISYLLGVNIAMYDVQIMSHMGHI